MVPCLDCRQPFQPYREFQVRCRTCQQRERKAQQRFNYRKRTLRELALADDSMPCMSCWFAPQCRDVVHHLSIDILPCFPNSHVHWVYVEAGLPIEL